MVNAISLDKFLEFSTCEGCADICNKHFWQSTSDKNRTIVALDVAAVTAFTSTHLEWTSIMIWNIISVNADPRMFWSFPRM